MVDKKIEQFSVSSDWLLNSTNLRLDASFYNPRVARAIETLEKSGLPTKTLGEVTEQIFIPPRFKRIYVDEEHGVPFLQGGHVVHFQPADLKYLSRTAHKRLERWIIQAGWILVTCSGTVGRVAIAPKQWDNWAASQHILRIVPAEDSPCPPGYLYAYLSSDVGQAQLTAQIYGAVVDELTEDQARSVLVPVPKTDDQKNLVAAINADALKAVTKRAEAAELAWRSVAEVANLLPALESESEGDERTGVEAFERFQDITQKLLQVPKHEVAGR